MTIRPGINAGLGLPSFATSHTTSPIPLGTIVEGYDDVNNRQNEYIWLLSTAPATVGGDVTYDANYATTDAAAGVGQADAIVVSAAGEYAWFQLKSRRIGP